MEQPSPARAAIYRDAPEQARRVDARDERYRFDLATDVSWELLDAPGLHALPSMIAGAGFDAALLRERPEAGALFDWSYAVAVCRVFEALEELILAFELGARALLPPTESLGRLCEDERKHLALFRRYRAHLERRHPGRLPAFERAFAPAARGLESLGRGSYPLESPDGHYVFWVNTLLFEELTVYYHERLGRPPEAARVQPAWRSVHAAHRVEEIQHVVTDEHYLRALELSPVRRSELSQATALLVVKHFESTLFPFAVAAAFVEGEAPGLPRLRGPLPVTRTPLFQELVSGPAWKRTRRHAPGVDRLRRPAGAPMGP